MGSSPSFSELLTGLLSPIAEAQFFPPTDMQIEKYHTSPGVLKLVLIIQSNKYFKQLPPNLISGDLLLIADVHTTS